MNEPLEPLHIKGDCNVANLSEADRNRLTSVSGWLDASHSTGLTLPALESCDSLDAFGSKEFSLPKLERVVFWLDARRSVGIDLPALESCNLIDAFGSTGLVISDKLARLHNISDSVRAKK